jgi:Carbohydrate binding domain (family 11)
MLVGYDALPRPQVIRLDGGTDRSDAGASIVSDAEVSITVPPALDAATDDSAAADSSVADGSESSAGDAQVDVGPVCASAVNACGGCSMLGAQPAASCGVCGLGALACSGPDSLVCNGASTLPKASSVALTIDDFEDGDSLPNPASGANGHWFAYSDHTGGTLNPPDGSPIMPAHMGAAGTTRSAHISGGGFTDYGAGLILWTNARLCGLDVSSERGIEFWIKGSTSTLTLSIATPQTLDPNYCGKDCNDFYGRTFALNGSWTHYTVPWSSLAQAGWGTPVPFDTKQVVYLQFSFGPRVNFELYLDEVSFF